MADRRRYLTESVRTDALAARKMAFVSGPRQVGKTTLGRALLESEDNCFSWDDVTFRRAWARAPLEAVAARGPGPILLDELHKDRRWQARRKGLFDLRYVRDKEKREVDFLVLRDRRPWLMVECKSNDTLPSNNLVRFAAQLAVPHRFELTTRTGFDRSYPESGVRVLGYERFLAGLV